MRVRRSSKSLLIGIIALPIGAALMIASLDASTSGSAAFITLPVRIQAAAGGLLIGLGSLSLIWSRALRRTDNVAKANDGSAVCITSVRAYSIESSLEPMGARDQFSHYFTVLIDREGLRIWSGPPGRPRVVFGAPRSSMISVRAGDFRRGFGSYRGILIALKAPSGDVLRVELPVLPSRVFGFARTASLPEIEKLLGSQGLPADSSD